MRSGFHTACFWIDKTFGSLRNAHESRPIKLPVEQSKRSTMKHVLILAAALRYCFEQSKVACLGNTEDQVNALMGKPTDPGKPDSDGITTNMYKNPTGEYIAVVQFLKGRSVAE